jgi:L-alanine-DL-glutamate epimerase-like enolase superfamily enzyme
MRDPKIDRIAARAYRIPTGQPEADGTFAWTSTTLIVVEAAAAGQRGLGYGYGDASAAKLIGSELADVVLGTPAMTPPAAWRAMVGAVRNIGRQGIAASAVAAVDVALWDLKARLLELPLAHLLGCHREAVPVYGSGGFTSYSIDQLQSQLEGWVKEGAGMVKMKVGSEPAADLERVRAARAAIGPETELFVDANGAYARKQALGFAARFAEQDVVWFEEPVSSDDLEGLRLLRDRAPPGMDITAGEYGYDLHYFRRMLAAGAVDVLQPDATRCAGVTGFMQAAALCRCHGLPLSAHTAPALHVHLCCAAETARHLEYFHDHVRIEDMLFEGAPRLSAGALRPDPARPGLGLELRAAEAARYAL